MSTTYSESQMRKYKYSDDNDLRETDPLALYPILEELSITGDDVIWEPCSGTHRLSNAMKRLGYNVFTSDIETYTTSPDEIKNFLEYKELPNKNIKWIITNPPYGNFPTLFALHGLTLAENVVFLVRSALINGSGKPRVKLMDSDDIEVNFYPFKNRIPMMHKFNYKGKKSTSRVDYAWFHWKRGKRLNQQIFTQRITCPDQSEIDKLSMKEMQYKYGPTIITPGAWD